MRVSIVVCNYNYARFLDGAIRSAVEQDYADKEVIVVDDGSTDGSPAIVAKWGDAVVAVHKSNGGQVSAYNAGFAKVTGDVVVFLDSDDQLDREACTRIAALFDDRTAKVHFRLRLVDTEGRALGPTIPNRLAEGDVSHRLRVDGDLYESSPGTGNAYRVAALRKLMPIPSDAKDRHGADFFCIYGSSLLGEVRAAGEQPLGSYRVHAQNAPELLGFGNAVRETQEPYRTYLRYERLRAWLIERLGPREVLPPFAPVFSLEKQGYVAAIFSAPSYLEGLQAASPLLVSKVLPSLRRAQGSWAFRAGLAVWAMGVLVLPRRAGLPLARYVCNPASR
jgi:glycosyltransferase involved in cell wall biosynthesis